MAAVERTRSVFLEPLTSARVKRFPFIACVSCFLRCKSIERLPGTLQNEQRLQNQFSFFFQNWPAGHQLALLVLHGRQASRELSLPCLLGQHVRPILPSNRVT